MPLKSYLPREHGAWAMWLVPLATGIWLSPNPRVEHVYLSVSLLILFLMAPVWLGSLPRLGSAWASGLKARALFAPGLLTIAAVALVVATVAQASVGPIAVLLYVPVGALAYARVVRSGRKRSIRGQMLAVLLLTAAAPLGLVVGGEDSPGKILVLHLLNFLFFSLSIFYVRAKVRSLRLRLRSNDWSAKLKLCDLCLGYLTLLIWVLLVAVRASVVPPEVCVAFLPAVVHTVVGLWRLHQPFSVVRLGLVEVVQSVAFGGLIILTFR